MKKFTIGTALVDPAANEVQKDGDVVRLEPKAVEVLYLLASKAGQTVSKEEILDAVWPKTVVTEDSIIRCVSQLRKAFGDPELIEAITKRGYRLNSAVMFLDNNDSIMIEKVLPKTLGWQKHLRWAIPLLFGLMATLVVWGNPNFPYWGVGAAIVIAASVIGVLLTPAIVKRMSES
jgi:DNA-binding winged helix-turn-helix (wHTH) protein